MRLPKIFRRRQLTIDDVISRSSTGGRGKSGLSFGFLNYGGGRSFRAEQSMSLSTVYRCVKLISDSIAQLPLKIFAVDSRGFRTELHGHPLASSAQL